MSIIFISPSSATTSIYQEAKGDSAPLCSIEAGRRHGSRLQQAATGRFGLRCRGRPRSPKRREGRLLPSTAPAPHRRWCDSRRSRPLPASASPSAPRLSTVLTLALLTAEPPSSSLYGSEPDAALLREEAERLTEPEPMPEPVTPANAKDRLHRWARQAGPHYASDPTRWSLWWCSSRRRGRR